MLNLKHGLMVTTKVMVLTYKDTIDKNKTILTMTTGVPLHSLILILLKMEVGQKDYSSEAYNYGAGQTIYTGPRGGQYYYNSKGNKVYVPKRN
ncbi:MAG: hypothetical protein IPG00_02265 [Saprospiraceae bacterium]|nr:hypothetical protein [Saprospiraceae bacterium]